MAELMVAGAALGALFNVVFDRLASAEVVDFFREKNLGPLLERMKTTLSVARVVLNDADKRQISDSDVKDWLNDLKDVVYMADDLLDQVSTKAAVAAAAATQKKVTTSNLLSCCFNAQHRTMATRSRLFINTQDRRNIATRLEEIVVKLEHILKLKESLDLKEIAMDNSSSRVPSTSVQDRNIYGRDVDKEAIIKLLLNGNNNGGEEISVIPIVGMGGVGKTTLAQMVYNDEDLQKKFDLKAWACVSEPFDIMKVTKTLSEKLIPKEASKLTNLNSLQEKLVEELKEKKFFIILDDVWNEDYNLWNLFKKSFQCGVKGSVILVTTRLQKVADVVQSAFQTYHLRQLSNEDCWSVFANHAGLCPGSGENTAILEEIGFEIVKKCKGLPLAAQSLGGLLRRKRDMKDWNNVLDCDIWELSEKESNIIPSLRISYHYLPSYLKRCFVYCSLYPKDYNFKKNDVILLWMAEDLLPPPKKGKTLKDVGDECFDYLVSSLFLQCSSDQLKKKEFFGMHDLMHDLATFIGGEFYFRSNHLDNETMIGSKTRHLSFINSCNPNSEFFRVLGRAKFLRSFLVLGIDISKMYREVQVPCTEVLCLEYLRILSFRYVRKLSALPDSISGMIHLRYLDLSWTRIKSLPESLCSLYNLQTLKLEHCDRLTVLPCGMQNLVNLHHLGIDGTCIKKMPKGMGKLKQLQHLPYFIVGKHEEIKIKELGGLSNLGGSFTINKLENVENGSEALEARMMDKKNIQDLVLKWSLDVEDCMDSQTEMDILFKLEPHKGLESLRIEGYRGTRYPNWVGKPCFHNMTRIELSNCKNCFTLPSLGGLPSLRKLSIYDMKSLVTIGASFFNNNDGGSLLTVVPFPSLITLTFEKMPCWEGWSCSEQPRAFPLLKRLLIKDCPKLKGDLPSHLPALEQLEIEDSCDSLPSLGRLPSLRELSIKKMKLLVTIDASFFNNSDGGSLLTVVPFPSLITLTFEKMPCWKEWSCCEQPRAFPLLKRLLIKDCRKLKGDLPSHLPSLEQIDIQDCKQLACSLPRAPAMRDITIDGCDSLTSLALDTYPNLNSLSISRCENLESVSVSQSGDGDVALHDLTRLKIERCPNLVSLAREGLAAPNLTQFVVDDCPNLVSLATEGLAAPSLTQFTVLYCDKLESLPPRMNTLLPNLKTLQIHDCPRIESLTEEGVPPSLRSIGITYCEKLLSGLASMDMLTGVEINGLCDGIKSFPKEGFPLLPPSLKSIYLVTLSSLETLDCKGLLHLTSLQKLEIYYCPKLENMAGERLPASLTELYIHGCPLLGEQCRTKHPQIWPKISHIHHIHVDGKEIS